MNLKVISKNIGIALLLNALFMYISAFVSFLYDVDLSFTPLMLSALITTFVGVFPLIFVKQTYEINIKEGFTIVVFSWILSCLFGMLPYILYGGEFTPVDAWFESVSGYTTTGATILNDIESVPKGLLFWRSSTHWLGGLGVVLFMLLVLPSVSTFRMKLTKMEISSLSKENYRFKTKETIRVISFVYLGLTVLETMLLVLVGMDLFDAINHSFSTVSTGGFSTRNLSILSYDSVGVEVVIIIFMILSGMHFGLLYTLVLGRVSDIFRSPIVKFYLFSLLIGSILVSLNTKFNVSDYSWAEAFRYGVFQVVSIGTTTGFANADSSVWPPFSILILIYFSFQCACSGSTTGGLKADRVLIFFKSVRVQLKKQLHPNAVLPVKIRNTNLDRDIVYSVNLYIVIYVGLVLFCSLLLSSLGLSLTDSLTSSVASMGNVGPGFGSVGSLSNYSHFPYLGKILLSFQMLLGRLEIYSILIVFSNKWFYSGH